MYNRHLKRIWEYKFGRTTYDKDPQQVPNALYTPFIRDNNLQDSDVPLQQLLRDYKYADYFRQKTIEGIKNNLPLYLYIWMRRIPGWWLDNEIAGQMVMIQKYYYPILDNVRVTSTQVLLASRFLYGLMYVVIVMGVIARPTAFKRTLPHSLLVILIGGAICLMGALNFNPRNKMPIDFFTYAFVLYALYVIQKGKHSYAAETVH